MASHLQPFTPCQVQNAEYKFHNFPQLPKELRDRIWNSSIQHTQIYHLHVYDLIHTPAPANHLANSEQDQSFFTVIDGTQTGSNLFRVNHESREAALCFYRVRIPCWFRTRSADGLLLPLTPGTLYFNPEHDFLRITSVTNTLLPFLHLLKTNYDPLHVGLRNLLVAKNDLSANSLQLIEPSTSDLDVFKNLHQVLFYSTVTLAGRQIYGGIRWAVLTYETKYNRSIPIQASVPTFDRLPLDPRAISEDLKDMYVGKDDPGTAFRLWNRIMGEWGIALDIEYKWCIAYEPRKEEIFDRETARKFMQKEDDIWNGIQDPISPTDQTYPNSDGSVEIGALSEEYKNEDLEQAVRPAFGFWVFPVKALESKGGWCRRNLSTHWPELWLASLSNKG